MLRVRCLGFICALTALSAQQTSDAQPAQEPRETSKRSSLARLGQYEKLALRSVLKARGLEIDPAPAGKVIGEVIVSPQDVFPPNAGALQYLNAVHRTTRADIIARELLIGAGDVWNQSLVRESERNIINPFVINLVVIMPVKSETAGKIDMLVVTSDVWSLRTNSEFEIQEDRLTFLTLSLAENNLLGWRKEAALVFETDQGAYSIGPRYRDPNVSGSRLDLLIRPRLIFSRDGSEFEGTQSETVLKYPLWSLARKWGASASMTHKNSVEREFEGAGLATYDNPATAAEEMAPRMFDNREVEFTAEGTRAIGGRIKHHLTGGYLFTSTDPSLPDEFPDDPVLAEAFIRNILPLDERVSALVARYRIFTPNFHTYRNINTYDLPEYQQVGPDATAELSLASELIGSTASFARYRVEVGWTVDLAGLSFARLSLGVSGRYTQRNLADLRRDLSAFVATPSLGGYGRLILATSFTLQTEVEDNERFVIGGDTGLRGYTVGAFRGTSFFRANVEWRSAPQPIYFLRAGLVAFTDVGHAADDIDELSARANVGFGIRMLAPQAAEDLYRIDWAFATRGPGRGFPGRLSIGFRQAF